MKKPVFKRVGEKVDPVPLEMPTGLKRPPTIQELIAASVRQNLFLHSQGAARESLEDSLDFDIEDPEFEEHTSAAEELFMREERLKADMEAVHEEEAKAGQRRQIERRFRRQPKPEPDARGVVGDRSSIPTRRHQAETEGDASTGSVRSADGKTAS